MATLFSGHLNSLILDEAFSLKKNIHSFKFWMDKPALPNFYQSQFGSNHSTVNNHQPLCRVDLKLYASAINLLEKSKKIGDVVLELEGIKPLLKQIPVKNCKICLMRHLCSLRCVWRWGVLFVQNITKETNALFRCRINPKIRKFSPNIFPSAAYIPTCFHCGGPNLPPGGNAVSERKSASKIEIVSKHPLFTRK